MPWWCGCHESTCEECVVRYFNHKGYRSNSPTMTIGIWNILRKIKWRNQK